MSNWPDVVCVYQPRGPTTLERPLLCNGVREKKKSRRPNAGKMKEFPVWWFCCRLFAASVAVVCLQIKVISADRYVCVSNVMLVVDSKGTNGHLTG